MLSVRGVYGNGEIKFREKISITREIPVIVTFLDTSSLIKLYLSEGDTL